MKFMHLLAEGETELAFANEILSPHLQQYDIELIVTKMDGLLPYNRVETELRLLLRNSSLIAVTTMFDFYGLPRGFPGRSKIKGNTPYERVTFCERAFEEKVNNNRFIAHLTLHEFEALLFSSPEAVDEEFPTEKQLPALKKIRSKFASPEEINDSQQTAPSKRLLQLFPQYQKDLNGINIARRITLARIREQCNHFDTWLQKLEQLTN